MTASLIAWLELPWEGELPFDGPLPDGVFPSTPTRLQVFAVLVGLNGGKMSPSGWGVTSSGGPYGRVGLASVEEMAHLMNLSAFISGWLQGTGNAENALLSTAIKLEAARVMAATKAG